MSDFNRVRRLYQGFREREPKRVKKIAVPRLPRAAMVMGYVTSISYDTTHGNRAQGYTHPFAPASRPLLCTDGKRLFIIGGRFRVTSRGIVDLDAHRREEP